jgi:hypothetical protein
MKRKMVALGLAFILALYCNAAYSHGEWVAASPTVATYPVVETPLVPSVTHTTYTVPVNYVRYQWVPVYTNRPVVVNTWGLFCRKQQFIYQPQVKWVLQPIYYNYR